MAGHSVGSCIACKGDMYLFGRRSGYSYCRCSACGTLQLCPMPNETWMSRAYGLEYAAASHYESDANICRVSAGTYYRSIVRVLKDYKVEGMVLDYGAGWGGLCEMLIENGFKCLGVEISHEMVSYCRSRDIPVRCGDITAVEGAKFSALVLCTVFEHLVDHDRWLAQANHLLTPNGLLITLQPTAAFADLMGRLLRLGNLRAPLPRLQQVFCPPWHTAFFSLQGMKVLANRHGFSVLEIRPAPQGRAGGLTGLAQRSLELINRFGWHLLKESWPLLVAHIFVLRKMDHIPKEGGDLI